MGTIAIKLDPAPLANPDLDLRSVLADRLAALTRGAVTDDGYDYLTGESQAMIIFLRSERPQDDVAKVLDILQREDFLGNNLYSAGVVAVDSGDGYKVVHPSNYAEDFHWC
jgi:hypothetical protein